MSPIASAIEPRRTVAIDRAVQSAVHMIERVAAALESNNMDLYAAFPSPNVRMDRATYRATKARQDMARSLVRIVEPRAARRPGDPLIVEMSSKAAQFFLAMAEQDAAAQFDAYVSKLEKKVGPCSSATLSSSPLWDGSVLTVQTSEGEQRWKTQMIINCSSLGKMFNQWPTRRIA